MVFEESRAGARDADGGPRGSGAAADDLIEATARPGPVLTLVIDPKAKRLAPADLARHVTTAFNEALQDLRANVGSAEDPVPDLALLADLLQDIQGQVHTSLSRLGTRLNAALAAAGDRARLDVAAMVDPTLDLFDRTRETLAVAQLGADADPDVRGEGTALRGDIRAVAAIGRIETVEIERGAMKKPAEDLADGLAEAANAAMRDLQAKTRTSGPVDRSKIKERTGEIRRLSVENMTAHAQAISDLLDRLELPGTDE
jgi:hypothetical protein